MQASELPIKEKKDVFLISTMHDVSRLDCSSEKKKPDVSHVIMLYNRNKVGVDAVDQMMRLYSTHSATCQRPLIGCEDKNSRPGSNKFMECIQESDRKTHLKKKLYFNFAKT